MTKTEKVLKKHICGIRRLRVKRQVKTPRAILLSIFDSFSLPNAKRLTIKAFFEVTLVSLILRALTVF